MERTRHINPLLLASWGYFLFVLYDTCIKILGSALPSRVVVVGTAFFSMTGIVFFSFVTDGNLQKIKSKHIPIHLIRSFSGIAVALCIATCLPQVSFSLFYTLAFTLPFWTTIWGIILFRERPNLATAIALLLGFSGVMVAACPNPDQFNRYSAMLIGAMVLVGLNSVLTKYIPVTEYARCLPFYPSTVCVIVLSPWLITFLSEVDSFYYPGYMILASMFAISGTICISRSYQLTETRFVAPLQYMQLLYATCIGYILWNETPNLSVMVGSVLIIGSGILILRTASSSYQLSPEKCRINSFTS